MLCWYSALFWYFWASHVEAGQAMSVMNHRVQSGQTQQYQNQSCLPDPVTACNIALHKPEKTKYINKLWARFEKPQHLQTHKSGGNKCSSPTWRGWGRQMALQLTRGSRRWGRSLTKVSDLTPGVCHRLGWREALPCCWWLPRSGEFFFKELGFTLFWSGILNTTLIQTATSSHQSDAYRPRTTACMMLYLMRICAARNKGGGGKRRPQLLQLSFCRSSTAMLPTPGLWNPSLIGRGL